MPLIISSQPWLHIRIAQGASKYRNVQVAPPEIRMPLLSSGPRHEYILKSPQDILMCHWNWNHQFKQREKASCLCPCRHEHELRGTFPKCRHIHRQPWKKSNNIHKAREALWGWFLGRLSQPTCAYTGNEAMWTVSFGPATKHGNTSFRIVIIFPVQIRRGMNEKTYDCPSGPVFHDCNKMWCCPWEEEMAAELKICAHNLSSLQCRTCLD